MTAADSGFPSSSPLLSFVNKDTLVSGACASYKSLHAARAFDAMSEGSALYVVGSNAEAERVVADLRFFLNDRSEKVVFIPDTEVLPYDSEVAHAQLRSSRVRAYHDLVVARQEGRRVFIVCTLAVALSRISPSAFWENCGVSFQLGQFVCPDTIRASLASIGYTWVDLEVSQPGEIMWKGDIVDMFPFGSTTAYRARFKEDVAKSIEVLNINTNRSTGEQVQGVTFFPAQEFPTDPDAFRLFQKQFLTAFDRSIGDPAYESVATGLVPDSPACFLPFFQKETTHLFDMSNIKAVFLREEMLRDYYTFESMIYQRYNHVSLDTSRSFLTPSQLWLNLDEMLSISSDISATFFAENPATGNDKEAYSLPSTIYRADSLRDAVDMLSKEFSSGRKYVFCVQSESRLTQIGLMCEVAGYDAVRVDTWSEALTVDAPVIFCQSSVDKGFTVLHPVPLTVVSESDIYGLALRRGEVVNAEIKEAKELVDLKNLFIGAPLVHLQHGVGRYKGTETTQIDGVEREFLLIGYANDATYYVPMDELGLVSRYGGLASEDTPIDVMGSDKWISGLSAAIEGAKDTARMLVSTQAERDAKGGIEISIKRAAYNKFCAEFPFQITLDQESAMGDIIQDLSEPKAMDRTVIGDVGFGKTEVAMRAAYISIVDGYQVVLIVPSTVLARQHFDSFRERLGPFGVNIGLLSSANKADAVKVSSGLKDGSLDVVIGTHSLLNDQIQFANLGLLVIDEEHRFGVDHKETIKNRFPRVNIMQLTATPIPRTLSMSLQGLRDMSIIATPPSSRLSIRTIVDEVSDNLVVDALQRELSRNGQVFYLHNNIATIDAKASHIESLLPDLRVGVVHGRMKELELERVMAAFSDHKFDILVATTIVEIGIDIPNANTIIIENADKLGVAQLHQLRGRVGRSNHQAYAYLLTDSTSVSESARVRLAALEEATNLGGGFALASHDLETRGAGEILGSEQSGHILTVGFSLYLRLLERAVEMVRSGVSCDITNSVKLDLGFPCVLPSTYIENPQARLYYNKRLSSAATIEEIDDIKSELIDCFGEFSDMVDNLIETNCLRVILNDFGVVKLYSDADGGILKVADAGRIGSGHLASIASKSPETFSLIDRTTIRFFEPAETCRQRLAFIFNTVVDATQSPAQAPAPVAG